MVTFSTHIAGDCGCCYFVCVVCVLLSQALPDDGVGEIKFIEKLINGDAGGNGGGGGGGGGGGSDGGNGGVVGASFVKGIVACCDLSRPDVEEELRRLVQASHAGRVKVS